MNETNEQKIINAVKQRLADDLDIRDLWDKLTPEFRGAGPDAVSSWLDAEWKHLSERTEELLREIDGEE